MRTKIILFAALAVVVLGGAYAFRHRIGGWAGAQTAQADNDPVIAKVNDAEIHQSELDHQISRVTRGQAPAPDQLAGIKKSAFNDLVSGHLLLQEAGRRGISASPEEIQQQVSNIEQRAGGTEGLNKVLADNHLTREQFQEGLTRDITISKLVQAAIPSEKVTPEEEHAFYDGNPELFAAPESLHARHILIRTDKDATAEQKAEAKKKADGLLEQVKAGGDFAALAQEHSEDPGSAPKGGDLGTFPRGRMVQPFEQAAFALKPGQVSEVVETQFGYHIIKVEEKLAPSKRTFEEVEPSIAQYLGQKKQRGKIEEFVTALRSKATVEVLDDSLKSAQSQSAASPQS